MVIYWIQITSVHSMIATLTSFSSASMGLPMKATILIFWFLFWRCFRANCMIWTCAQKFVGMWYVVCMHVCVCSICMCTVCGVIQGKPLLIANKIIMQVRHYSLHSPFTLHTQRNTWVWWWMKKHIHVHCHQGMYVVAHVSDPDASYKVDLALGLQVL